jgi:hypothetical protein
MHNDDEHETFPLSSELIGTVLHGRETDVLKGKHIRFVTRKAHQIVDGRITLVIKDCQIVAIEPAKTYDFSE